MRGRGGSGGDRDYRNGAVVRVSVHNFVTYKDVDFYPGPHLNMVIGPNGSGKSTLVCALCLGLCGAPSVRSAPCVGYYSALAQAHPPPPVHSCWGGPRS
jgi:ATPase subunit of ABC transporter with duplicated ATPase domains